MQVIIPSARDRETSLERVVQLSFAFRSTIPLPLTALDASPPPSLFFL